MREQKGTLIDLFCGGFAIGETFLKNGWSVIANDKNKYIIALLKNAISGKTKGLESKFVTRQEYFDVLKNPDKYDDWYVGYLMSVWSFGNNQKCYLFGKDIEPIKKAAHELIFNDDESNLLKFIPIPKKYIDGIKKQKDWHKKRIALRNVCSLLKTQRIYKDLQQLEQLQRLEQLQQLQQLQQLELFSKDYKEIKIPKKSIVYCDPPYKGTATYSEKDFNHVEFFDYCRKLSKTNHIYISEYNAPDDFKPILAFNQKSTLQGGSQKHNNQPQEKLFIHESIFSHAPS